MKYGFVLIGNAQEMVTLAQEAEAAGWDGVFLADDWGASWIVLTAIAACTQRLLLGTMLTPLPQHLPWTIAAQAATLDQLSNGRVILATGLGVIELDKVGLRDNTLRAQMLNEGLELVDAWWQGQPIRPFTYHGRHYHLQPTEADVSWITHKPLQQPRIPIWVVDSGKASQLRRAVRWDGALMSGKPEEVRQRKELIASRRDTPFDIIVEGETPAHDSTQAASLVQAYADAGATWWMESMWDIPGVQRDYDMLTRIKMGPPRPLTTQRSPQEKS